MRLWKYFLIFFFLSSCTSNQDPKFIANNQLIIDEEISTTTKLRVISKNFQLIRLDFETHKESYHVSKLDELVTNFNLIVNQASLTFKRK